MPEPILNKPTKVVTADTQAQKDRKEIDQLIKYKQHWEPRWYLAQAFYEGVHFTYPKKDTTGTWQRKSEIGKNKVIREIPKAKKQIDSVRNLLLKLRQRPTVYPDSNVIIMDNPEDPEAQENEIKQAEMQGRYIEHYMNEVMKLPRHKKKLARYAELYNVAYIQILNENGKKEFKVYDPFEISVYPTISNINEYPVVAKHVGHRFSDLVGNDLYDQEVIMEIEKNAKDGKYSKSIYKDSYMRERYGNAPDDNVVVDEIYKVVQVKIDANGEVYDESQEEELDENGEPIKLETTDQERVQIRAYIGDKKVRDEVTRLTKIPIAMFCWGDEAYATSLMEDLMPLNKSYDIFASKLEHKAKKLDTGRLAIQKGEDHKIYTTNDGEIIRYKRIKPTVMDEASVPNAFMETLSMIERDMKEQGVSLTSGAGIPPGVEAWRAIESLKEIDRESIGEQQDNMNECLVDLSEKLTEMLAYDMTTIENVQLKNDAGDFETVKVTGERGKELLEGGDAEVGLPQDVTVIDPNRTITWEIESELTWTQEGRRAIIVDLIRAGVLPSETGLDALRFGNTKDIMQKLIQEKTHGQTMIDMPDFQALPIEMQQEILQLLSSGAGAGGEIPQAQPPQ